MTFDDFVNDRVKTCPHCFTTMMMSDFHGGCHGKGCTPKRVIPSIDEWWDSFLLLLKSTESNPQ